MVEAESEVNIDLLH